MSALQNPPVNPSWALDVSGTAPVPFGRLVKVEFRKMLDTRSGLWLLISTLALLVITIGIVLLVVGLNDDVRVSASDWMQILTLPLSVLLPVFPILCATSEWSQRTGLVTFSLEANRAKVMVAKLASVLLLAVATVVVAAVLGAVANPVGAALGGSDVQWNLDGEALFWTVTMQLLYFLMAFGIGASLLNSPGAIALFYVVALLLPMMVWSVLYALFSWAQDVIPFIDLQFAVAPFLELNHDTGLIDVAHIVVATLIWVVAPLAFGLRRIVGSEVK